MLHTILRFKWCFVAISVSRTLFQSPFFVSDCGFFPSFPLLMHALYCLYLSSVICPVLCPRFHLAATRGHLDCLNLILGHNVDVTATDASGEFCLDWNSSLDLLFILLDVFYCILSSSVYNKMETYTENLISVKLLIIHLRVNFLNSGSSMIVCCFSFAMVLHLSIEAYSDQHVATRCFKQLINFIDQWNFFAQLYLDCKLMIIQYLLN